MANSFLRWLTGGREETAVELPLVEVEEAPRPKARAIPVDSELSTTVFNGESESWLRHMKTPWSARFDSDAWQIRIVSQDDRRALRFLPVDGTGAEGWCKCLNAALGTTGKSLANKPAALKIYEDLLSAHALDRTGVIELRPKRDLPGPATREIRFDDSFSPLETRILLNRDLVEKVGAGWQQSKKSGPLQNLGQLWPILRRILLQVAYPNYPRDRFVERIEITARWLVIHLHLLYKGKEDGKLIPNKAGVIWEEFMAREESVELAYLHQRHPFFRLLNDLSFLLNDRLLETGLETAKIFVRDYLDGRYLRLSLAGLMPESPEWLQPMEFEWKGKKKVKTPTPRVGQFGILDEEDLDAWKKMRGPLAESHYHLVRQIGLGQFGRVYEAINAANATIPTRVAVKVDRIRKGMKKEAIEAAEIIMDTARGLSSSPHVIRVFDAGKLPGIRASFHVLQLVDGDTLDNLLGIAGAEHSSVMRPPSQRESEQGVQQEFLKALSGSPGEIWRRARGAPPFVTQPDLADMLDLLVSKTLWVEEVHGLGFAVNDLKNGNVMINRRGQFKAIDLDAYSRIFSHLDKMPDFFFLAVSTVQLLTAGQGDLGAGHMKSLFGDSELLRTFLREQWNFREVPAIREGRFDREELVGFLVRFVEDARTGEFSREPAAFRAAIDALILLKRRLGNQEMVLE